MGDMLLGYENWADDDGAVYSGGSWQLSLDNIKTPYVRERARSTNLNLSSTQFTVNLGADRSVKLWCLTHTNLSSAATIRMTWYNSSAVEIANSGWVAINAYPSLDPESIGAAHFYILSSPATARSGKVEIDDQANAAGYVEIGRHFMLADAGISRDPDAGMGEEMMENSQVLNAIRGTRFVNRRIAPRKYSFGYNFLDATDAARVRRLRRYCNLDKQVVIIPDPDDTANYFERNFVGTLNAMPSLALLSAGLVEGRGFEILEVV